MVTPIGKEAWIPLADTQLGLPAAYAALLLLLVDAAVCMFFLDAVPAKTLAARLPRVGRGIARLADRVRDAPAAQRSLAAALALALMLPIHSGGAILGTLGGRSIGLPRVATFLAVTTAVAVRFGVVLLAYEGWLAWSSI